MRDLGIFQPVSRSFFVSGWTSAKAVSPRFGQTTLIWREHPTAYLAGCGNATIQSPCQGVTGDKRGISCRSGSLWQENEMVLGKTWHLLSWRVEIRESRASTILFPERDGQFQSLCFGEVARGEALLPEVFIEHFRRQGFLF